MPRIIEGELAAHDQLFQILVSRQLLVEREISHRQRHFQRRDVAEVQIGAHVRRCVLARFVPGIGVMSEMLFAELGQTLLRFAGATAK